MIDIKMTELIIDRLATKIMIVSSMSGKPLNGYGELHRIVEIAVKEVKAEFRRNK